MMDLKSFEKTIKEHENQLFGLLLYKRGVKLLCSHDPNIIKMTDSSFENIVNRTQETIINAKLLLEEAKKNPKKMKELDNFHFPPIKGHPFLDEMAKRVKIVLESYEELFPNRPREQNLSDEEVLKLTALSIKKTFY